MANVITYPSKLKDPLWQRKRLHIFERDNFKCTCCKAERKELQVHHLEYLGDIQPWEYPDDLLATLCVDCHQKEMGRSILESNLAVAFRVKGFLYSDLMALSCIIHNEPRFTNRLLKTLRSYE